MKEAEALVTVAIIVLTMYRKSLLRDFGYDVSWFRHIRDWRNFTKAISEESEPETKRQYQFLQTIINLLFIAWVILLIGIAVTGA